MPELIEAITTPAVVTTLEHATAMRAYAGKIVADLETIETMLLSLVSDNIPESFIVVCDNLNYRIHTNMGALQLHYLNIEKDIVERLKD